MESRESFEKLTVLAVGVSVRTLQLVQAREGSQLRVGQVFSAKEVEVLRVLSTTLEGRTKQQQNPHQGSLPAWAAWIIARLGGWKGHARERKAGPITMFHGLQRFEQLSEGFQLAQQKICAYHSSQRGEGFSKQCGLDDLPMGKGFQIGLNVRL